MIEILIALFAGIVFAIGLVLSGMTNPSVVLGFLDIFGSWNYSLAFVMIGAIGVNLILFNYLEKRKPLCAQEHHLPQNKNVDKKIIVGSALFGIGWGIAGICPGPGIVNLVTNESAAFVFVGSLIAGMILYKLTSKLWD